MLSGQVVPCASTVTSKVLRVVLLQYLHFQQADQSCCIIRAPGSSTWIKGLPVATTAQATLLIARTSDDYFSVLQRSLLLMARFCALLSTEGVCLRLQGLRKYYLSPSLEPLSTALEIKVIFLWIWEGGEGLWQVSIIQSLLGILSGEGERSKVKREISCLSEDI